MKNVDYSLVFDIVRDLRLRRGMKRSRIRRNVNFPLHSLGRDITRNYSPPELLRNFTQPWLKYLKPSLCATVSGRS